MGVWGLGSDENDATYDAVGIDLMERVSGVSFVNPGQEDPRLEKLPADLRKNKPQVFDQPGVVILLLKLGCAVEVEAIQKAQSALELQLLALPWRGDGITGADSPTGRASRQYWNPGATGILPEHQDNPEGRKAAIDEETKLCEEAIANGAAPRSCAARTASRGRRCAAALGTQASPSPTAGAAPASAAARGGSPRACRAGAPWTSSGWTGGPSRASSRDE